MKKIKLSQNKFALIDNEDFEKINQYKWCAKKGFNTYYATSTTLNGSISMHRLLTGFSKQSVDHIDGNGLNNQRANLRLCSHKQNMRNRKLNKNSTTGYKGVSFHKRAKKFTAQIKYNSKQYCLGSFNTAEEAADAYDERAKQWFGEFAKLNTELAKE